MTVAEAAVKLGHKHHSRLYDLIKKGRVGAQPTDKGIEVDEASLNAYMESRRKKAVKEAAFRPVPKVKAKS